MVNIIHLQKVSAPNPFCQVKVHEESCHKVSPIVQVREKAARLHGNNDSSGERIIGWQYQPLWQPQAALQLTG